MVKSIVILGIVMAAALAGAMAAPRSKRVTEETETMPPERVNKTEPIICDTITPCGWTVYTPGTKMIEYFMNNDYCICARNLECSKYDDDISIGALVHRCQSPLSITTTEAS